MSSFLHLAGKIAGQATRAPSQTNSGTLKRLPKDVRDRIYKSLVVPESGHVSINVKDGKPFAKQVDLRFMRVCRQLRREATPIFYSINRFTIITKYLEAEGEPRMSDATLPFEGTQLWLSAIGLKNAKTMSKLCIDLGWYTVEGAPERITQMMGVARDEIARLRGLPASVTVLRAAYFIEVFPPIGHIMRYIDIPVGDRQQAKQILDATTNRSKEKLPAYAFNRGVVDHTMDLFKDGILDIVFKE